ncbi:MAG: hypothetical protein J1E57_02925 [Prevotella sp.]|nr:hypothetical protein [Prevotella sp.]
MHRNFPHTVSYNRFVGRQAQVGILLLFLQTCALAQGTGFPSLTPRRWKYITSSRYTHTSPCGDGWKIASPP